MELSLTTDNLSFNFWVCLHFLFQISLVSLKNRLICSAEYSSWFPLSIRQFPSSPLTSIGKDWRTLCVLKLSSCCLICHLIPGPSTLQQEYEALALIPHVSLGIHSRHLERNTQQSCNYLITQRPPENWETASIARPRMVILPERSAMEKKKSMKGTGGKKTDGTPLELIYLNGAGNPKGGDDIQMNSRKLG